MNRKSLWIILFAFILLVTFAAVYADQDGKDSWCNIDEYGCWVTGEDGGNIYIMFWSEEARLYIMGAGSPPYKLVVSHPGFTGRLTIESGIPKPAAVVIPTVTPPVVIPTVTPPVDDEDEPSCYDGCLETKGCNVIMDEIKELEDLQNSQGSLDIADQDKLNALRLALPECLATCHAQCD